MSDTIELLGPSADWRAKLDELYTWTGSATVETQPELYHFLCSLIGYLCAGYEAAANIEIAEHTEAIRRGLAAHARLTGAA